MSMMVVARVLVVHGSWQYTKHNVICRDATRPPTWFLKVRSFLNANTCAQCRCCANARIKRMSYSNSRNLPFREIRVLNGANCQSAVKRPYVTDHNVRYLMVLKCWVYKFTCFTSIMGSSSRSSARTISGASLSRLMNASAVPPGASRPRRYSAILI
jgi:hypothetical protein